MNMMNVVKVLKKYQVREMMQEKRKQKIDLSIAEAYEPSVLGQGSIAIIGWGSTKCAIDEVLKELNDTQLFHVHFV